MYQAEVIVAQIQSVSTKFGLVCNLEEMQQKLEDEKQEQTLSSEEKFSRFLSKRKPSLKEQDKTNEQQEVRQFVLDLLDNYEVEVPGAGKGVVGKKIRHLFSEAQRVNNISSSLYNIILRFCCIVY